MTHVVVVGAGGNIGSHLVPHLARLPGLDRLTLIDRDRYEPRNAANQDFPSRASGRRKARVQAARARRLNPRLTVVALAEAVEELPLGALRADLLVACLDSRRARQWVNHAAGRLGVPWLDGGVLAGDLLGRVTRFLPGSEQPCLECRWDDADYAAVEQAYPCEPAVAAPTGAPSGLGALVAALLALECTKLLSGAGRPLEGGAELVLDAAHHRHFVTAARRNPGCRRTEHAPWRVEPLPDGPHTTLGELLDAMRSRLGANGDLALRVEGKRFARLLCCERCGATRRVLRLAGGSSPERRRCPACGGPLGLTGFGLADRVEADTLSQSERRRRLTALGLRPGEVVSVGTAEREVHLELMP